MKEKRPNENVTRVKKNTHPKNEVIVASSKKNVNNTNKSQTAKKTKKRKPMKHRRLFRLTSLLLLITTFIFLINLGRMNFLGVKYMSILCLIIFIFEFIILFTLNKRFKVILKIPFFLMSILLSALFIFGIYNLNITATFIGKMVSASIKEERYETYVLNDSEYSSIEDLNEKTIGILDNGSETLDDAIKLLKKRVTFKKEDIYKDIEDLMNDCINRKVDAIFLSNSMIEFTNSQYTDMFNRFKKINDLTVSIKENIKKSDVDVTKDPFLIYVSGIDTYGSINTVSRSDVNMLIAVNPKTEKILLVNTPRDFYVKLHSKKAFDKLTHAGIYGTEESLKTLEDLYATDIDFYLKINFSSLIKIVDAIGGVTVNSKFNFSYDGFDFHKGSNRLNGAGALAFSRYRKTLPGGDISRGENQQAVIKAIIEKIMNPSIISKYSKILDSMSKSFVTNMSEEDIYALAKFQLNKNPKWKIDSQNATGSNSYETTYSAGKAKLYVMLPNEQSVTDVKHKLNEILEED